MTDATPSPATVVDCAAAADGGSLWVQLSVGGQIKNYTLNRSIASRGTPQYGEVSSEHGPLSKQELHDLVLVLDVPQRGMYAGLVEEFVQFLKKSALD
ncbi:hypothetical protein [Mesorhizobium sp. 1M-11]|uniref:hypothetical protein n=1 Tax=Mesorhizobium sp. 1M-11 TaxID=1529006 RepID=UPI0006C756CC|nr:hypothetical protein [Mesorhizobium sp. 1M-11]